MKIVILDGYTENPGDLSWGELEKLGERKQAVFCIIPDSNDASLNFLVGMLYTCAHKPGRVKQ